MTHDRVSQTAPSGRRASRDAAFEVVLGERIRAARIAAKLTQAVLSEAVGVSYQQMQKYETGKDRVSAGTLRAIAVALGVAPGSFFNDDDSSPPARPVPLKEMREAQRIGERIARLRNPVVIRRLVALVDAVADMEGDDDRQLRARDDPEMVN